MSPLRQFAAALGVAAALCTTTPSSAACDLVQSVYRDAGQRGFTLEFFPRSASAALFASAEVRHVKRGRLFRFDVGQSNGYGSFYGEAEGRRDPFPIYLFNEDLTQSTGMSAARVFVGGLGVADHYRSDKRADPQLGDTVWVFERCRTAPAAAKR